jgi:hypothetical protein
MALVFVDEAGRRGPGELDVMGLSWERGTFYGELPGGVHFDAVIRPDGQVIRASVAIAGIDHAAKLQRTAR